MGAVLAGVLVIFFAGAFFISLARPAGIVPGGLAANAAAYQWVSSRDEYDLRTDDASKCYL